MKAFPAEGWLNRSRVLELLKRSFWFLPFVAMLIGGGLGFVVPMLDSETGGEFGIFATSDLDSARGLLATIATATLSVAGITFSVTVVALQLASQQLGPRVLRTFQTDRLNQATLAVFLGLFVYALIALGRLSTITLSEEASSPNLVLTSGVVLSVFALGLFAAFIQNTVVSLQASAVIERIADEGADRIRRHFPSRFGAEAADSYPVPEPGTGRPIRARGAGFLTTLPARQMLQCAAAHDGFVVQRAQIGDYIIAGTTLAEAYGGDPEHLVEQMEPMLRVERERTLVEDLAFPIRQLADIALRALSPGLNDPTTAENAMGALTHLLAQFAREDPVQPARTDERGALRFIALAPALDDLVRLGFDQVRSASTDHEAVEKRLAELLAVLREVASGSGASIEEIDRQHELLAAS